MSAPRAAIYLDANAGAPLRPEVTEALRALLAGESATSSVASGDSAAVLLPNPSSVHSHGRRAKRWLTEARERISQSLGQGIDTEQLVLTSSGTEANQLAIRSVLEPRLDRGEPVHWITTPVEHDSVLQLIPWVKARGGEVTFLPVDEDGVPEVSRLASVARSATALVSCLWVNNETGAVTRVAELAREARRLGIALHLDAAQAWGKVSREELSLPELGSAYVAFSGHKIGAPAGTGLLWLGRGARLAPLLAGKQEKGRRGGTENLLGTIALGAAAGALASEGTACLAGLETARDRLERKILATIPGTRVNGAGARRVGNTLNLSFDGVEGDGLVLALDLAGFSVSSGSACSSGVLEPSHVLLAMGRTRAQAMSALRISLAEPLDESSEERLVSALAQAVGRIRGAAQRAASGAYEQGRAPSREIQL